MQVICDEDLLVASRKDPTMFTPVFEHQFGVVHGYLARRVGPDLADELASETFVRAFQHRDRFDPERGPTRAWLLGIATNLLRRHYRSEHRRLIASARVSGEARQPDETAAVDARVAAGVWGLALARALASVRDADRDVLLLVAWGELTYAEAAAALDIPIGTVRSRLARAKREIRTSLERAGFPSPAALPRSPASRAGDASGAAVGETGDANRTVVDGPGGTGGTKGVVADGTGSAGI